MKYSPIPPIVLCVSLVLAGVGLFKPPTVLAESGSANCGGGRTVYCSAYRCVCINNVGCTGYDSQNRVVSDNPCPARAPLEEAPVE